MEWHLDPVYILDNWTEELLYLMVSKMADRHDREAAARRGDGSIRDFAGPEAAGIPGVKYEKR